MTTTFTQGDALTVLYTGLEHQRQACRDFLDADRWPKQPGNFMLLPYAQMPVAGTRLRRSTPAPVAEVAQFTYDCADLLIFIPAGSVLETRAQARQRHTGSIINGVVHASCGIAEPTKHTTWDTHDQRHLPLGEHLPPLEPEALPKRVAELLAIVEAQSETWLPILHENIVKAIRGRDFPEIAKDNSSALRDAHQMCASSIIENTRRRVTDHRQRFGSTSRTTASEPTAGGLVREARRDIKRGLASIMGLSGEGERRCDYVRRFLNVSKADPTGSELAIAVTRWMRGDDAPITPLTANEAVVVYQLGHAAEASAAGDPRQWLIDNLHRLDKHDFDWREPTATGHRAKNEGLMDALWRAEPVSIHAPAQGTGATLENSLAADADADDPFELVDPADTLQTVVEALTSLSTRDTLDAIAARAGVDNALDLPDAVLMRHSWAVIAREHGLSPRQVRRAVQATKLSLGGSDNGDLDVWELDPDSLAGIWG